MPDRKQISFIHSKELLERYGINVSGAVCRPDRESTAKAAEEAGYPVVLKVNSEKIVHKSDIGGVVLDIKNAME